MILLSVRIVNVTELRRIRSYSTKAALTTPATFLAVVILGVELGVLIAVVLSLLDRTVRMARPELNRLQRRSDGHWLPAGDDGTLPSPGVLVLRLNGPLWFANASWFHDEAAEQVRRHPAIHQVIIDTTGIDDMDFTGAWCLIDVVRSRGIDMAVSSTTGLAGDAIGRIHLTSPWRQDACSHQPKTPTRRSPVSPPRCRKRGTTRRRSTRD